MDKLEMVQAALRELEDGSAEQLVALVKAKYGAAIDPRFIPLFKASLRERARSEAFRLAAKAAAAHLPAT